MTLAQKQPTGEQPVPARSDIIFVFLLVLGFLKTALPCCAQTADSFNPGITIQSSVYPAVYALGVQPDGKILAAGALFTVASRSQNFMGRVNADGTADAQFAPFDSYGSNVVCMSVQPDGKIIVGGNFKRICGQTRSCLARLLPDGNLDTPFNTSADAVVKTVAAQPDGKILAGGSFTNLDGQLQKYLCRLNADGTLDATFNPVFDGAVNTLALQRDGAILVGGSFLIVNGQSAARICRLNPDGRLDTNFVASADNSVSTMAVQGDGKIIVGGAFTTLSGQPQAHLGRLTSAGSLDNAFSPVYSRNAVSLSLQTDGRMIVAGLPTSGSQSVTNVVRLNPDGTPDSAFNAGAVGSIFSLALQTDGKLLLAGASFSQLAGQSRTNIGRLNNTDGATQSLTFDGSTVTWLRGGTSPEVSSATFEISTDGTNWSSLGAAGRIAGGWQLATALFPSNSWIRARGVVTGGYANASSWPIELASGPPLITVQPVSHAVTNSQNTTFTVVASGSPTLTYQWRRNGLDIPNATTSLLTITNVSAAQIGDYDVRIANPMGITTSSIAALTLSVPVSVTNFSQLSSFTIQALALQPDGRVLVATSPSSGGTLYRLNLDGSIENLLNAGINAIAIQDDQRILLGGSFNSIEGQPRTNLCRIYPNGTLDTSFSPGANGQIYCLALQADGKIVIGGTFSAIGGQPHTNLARLNINGSPDDSFQITASGSVFCLGIQADDAIVLGGTFSSVGAQPRAGLARIRPDGSLDSVFNPGSGSVLALAIQPDGRIVAGGSFSALGGQSRSGIGRLNADGTIDTTFNPAAGATILGGFNTLALQVDGRILVGGTFQYSVSGGRSVNYFGRLNTDGTFDPTFTPSTGAVLCMAVQPDGQVFAAGGSFLKRCSNTEPATGNLAVNGSRITWLRGGTTPEVWRTSFDFSTNGIDWVNVGSGARLSGGWASDASTALPPEATIRARGYMMGGGGSWGFSANYAEQLLFQRPLTILTMDAAFGVSSNRFGFNITGSPAQTAVVEVSTNLTSWTTISTNLIGGGPLYVSDPIWTNFPRRFYRLRSL